MLILRTLAIEPAHGWGICDRIQQRSGDVFSVNQGTLYPALERLQLKGWIKSEWRVTDHGRKARYYIITRTGRKHFEAEQNAWRVAARAIDLVLGPA
jgi:transcriptional regulator